MKTNRFFVDHYGGKKAILKYFFYSLVYKIGGFTHYRHIKWHQVNRLVFVCKGNICRSPYAKYRAKSLGIHCISFGLMASDKKPVNEIALKVVKAREIDLSHHQSSNINNYKSQDGDLLIGFEPWHVKSLKEKINSSNIQITLIGLWCNKARRPYLHDPYGLDPLYFDKCFTIIDDALENIASLIKRYKRISWRSTKNVLVTEADTIGSIAVIRSLGRAGYRVFACSSQLEPMGFKSSFISYSETNPNYHEKSYFLDWLDRFVKKYAIDVIIPSEGFLLAIKPLFSEYAHLLPCSHKASIVYKCLSKYDLFHIFSTSYIPSELRQNLPAYTLIDSDNSLPVAKLLFEQLGSPLYAKVDALYSRTSMPGKVYRLDKSDNAHQKLQQLVSKYKRILIQSHSSGIGVGVFFLIWEGTIKAHYMHRRIHEVPHTGGVSSYRSSWWHSGIYIDALKRIEHLKWNGVAMMEYRWDPKTDQFCLIELNSRFWGSLHLAIYAGVDFPTLLVDAFLGKSDEKVLEFKRNVSCRLTFPNEIQYVWSILKDKQLPLSIRLWSVIEFFLLSLNPNIYSDMLFAGDRGLYWLSIKKFIQQILKQ